MRLNIYYLSAESVCILQTTYNILICYHNVLFLSNNYNIYHRTQNSTILHFELTNYLPTSCFI